MIAASEKFLRQIQPVIRDDGDLNPTHLLVAAMDAGTRLHPNDDAAPYLMPETSRAPFYWLMYAVKLPRSDCGETSDTDWVAGRVRESIALGMPFVGWSIGSESRRINTPAQPGEGDFIKHLGRDF